jgi:AcrR family transcriptional regulator
VSTGRGAESERKQTQRRRILDGVVAAVAHDGYAGATIAQIIAHAGVSRPTFYDYFIDKQASFIGALEAIHGELLLRVEAAVERSQPGRCAHAAIEALLDYIDSQPARAGVLINSSLEGGPQALDARDRGVAEIARIIEQAHQRLTVAIPDVRSDVLVGGTYRVLGSQMRKRKPADGNLLAELLAWVDSYSVPMGFQRWSSLGPHPIAAAPFVPEAPFGSQPPLARRHRSQLQTMEDHRQSLLFATAQIASEKGFSTSTITDITRRAGVNYRKFRCLFADKQDAFLSFYELGARRTLEVTIGAFFSHEQWPDRVWTAGQAFAGFLDNNPGIPPVGFVEAYAVGPRIARQMDRFLRAFTLFLHEGYGESDRRQRPRPSRIALDAIAHTIFETSYRETRLHRTTELTSLLPQAVFIVLAPFVGSEEAGRFIDRKLAESQ